ncbi:Fibronectin type III domain-containing protein 3B [Acipenser ruthenus]|uniref:Fibronectin type III domain-containing protein 3B n=1 Tax=Acipenser ruthenus TaxID=7906 RepID=A0A444U693_ACIRT|nr:Fibronectin type III domain-containing protein 3B [Acipenser ruthenus]
MMMTDQIPLDLPALLNGELPMMPHMVNGDGSQQVIFVQVNPGETFTIRAEDGSLQCIQAVTEPQHGGSHPVGISFPMSSPPIEAFRLTLYIRAQDSACELLQTECDLAASTAFC